MDVDLWDLDQPITSYESLEHLNVPAWMNQDVSPLDVASIQQGGCASGAYMPAVTYYHAVKTMTEHGDDVLDYITDRYGSLPAIKDEESWSGIAVFYLSIAVELWASEIAEQIEEDYEDEGEEE